jgi:hypothetical protein
MLAAVHTREFRICPAVPDAMFRDSIEFPRVTRASCDYQFCNFAGACAGIVWMDLCAATRWKLDPARRSRVPCDN